MYYEAMDRQLLNKAFNMLIRNEHANTPGGGNSINNSVEK